MLELIHEINCLWQPVYPHLSEQVRELYGRDSGRVLDVGPFAGTIFDLKRKLTGGSFLIASFPSGMSRYYRAEATARNMDGGIDIVESSPTLACIRDNTIDVIVFRGALFFPDLFRTDLPAVHRVLRPGGVGFVGGGFGKYTPPSVIDAIGERSRELNFGIGKVMITPDAIWQDVKGQEVEKHMEVISEGGLWVVVRK
jgi:hypothetical protein